MPKILVIDDHPVNLRLIQKLLASLGHECDTATNAMQGLALWKDGSYRIVITDCHMPGPNGQVLANLIRSEEAARGGIGTVAILAWTADAMADNISQCFAAGMNGYLLKPTLLTSLKEAIDVWLADPDGPATPSSPTTSNAASDAASRATPENNQAAEVLSPLNESVLKQFTGNDPEAEQEILSEFLEINTGDIQALRAALSGQETDAVTMLAHRIKGACRIMGATPLAGIFETIEMAAKARDWPAIKAALPPMEAEHLALTGFIRQRMAHT